MIPFHFESHSAHDAGRPGVILPANLKNKTELLAFLHRAIPLPDYFGDNWDALEECLRELDWLDRPTLVLVHRDIPLDGVRADQRIYLQILANAARGSNRLSVIFPESVRQEITRLLAPNDGPPPSRL